MGAILYEPRVTRVLPGRAFDAFGEIVYGGTLTDAVFGSVDDNSIVESDVAATSISGGIVLDSFVVSSTASARSSAQTQVIGQLPLTLDIAGQNPIPLSVVATSFGGSAATSSSIEWSELR